MTKKQFFELMDLHQLRVNFDDRVTVVDEGSFAPDGKNRYFQTWAINPGITGPNASTAYAILSYFMARRRVRGACMTEMQLDIDVLRKSYLLHSRAAVLH